MDIYGLTPGKEPKFSVEVDYVPDNDSKSKFTGKVEHSVETFSNDTYRETVIYANVTTYETYFDEKGNEQQRVVFVDEIVVRNSMTITYDPVTLKPIAQDIRKEVQAQKNNG